MPTIQSTMKFDYTIHSYDFQVIEYWQGHEPVHSRHENTAIGYGNTHNLALDDALDKIAEQEDFGINCYFTDELYKNERNENPETTSNDGETYILAIDYTLTN